MLIRADTPRAREIWATVECAAARCPEWMHDHVVKVAREAARRIALEAEE